MNKLLLFVLFLAGIDFGWGQSEQIAVVDKVLDAWHMAATKADYEGYFGRMTPDAIFIGTDATENWSYGAFKSFAKPYFDRGRAWDFAAVERHIFLNENEDTAWFDELLDTWMGLCRGSGVLKKEGMDWKIAHYVLSIAVPNEQVNELLALKKTTDSILTQDFKSRYKVDKNR